MYEAVIFDNDGVLVGPTRWEDMLRAVRRAFAIERVDDPDEDHVRALAGGVSLADLRRVDDVYDVDVESLWESRDRLASAAQLASVAEGFKQPYEDVGVVRDLEVPAAVVSSNQAATLQFLLDRHDLTDHLVSAYGRRPGLTDLARKKPAPYFPNRALADLQQARDDGALAPDDVVMVGDNESDVRAAHAAGVDAAFVRREHRTDWELDVEPEHELADLHELVDLLSER